MRPLRGPFSFALDREYGTGYGKRMKTYSFKEIVGIVPNEFPVSLGVYGAMRKSLRI